MNTYILIITLSISILPIVHGKITNGTCVDDNFCKDKDTTQCYISYIHYKCPNLCGVCNATCKDYFEHCNLNEKQCYQPNQQKLCPKTCGVCDVCEDLIESELCTLLATRDNCENNTDVAYSCKKTCGYCCCYDNIKGPSCKRLKEKGYCKNKNLLGCCKTCGFCN